MKYIVRILYSSFVFALANVFALCRQTGESTWIWLAIPLVLWIQIKPSFSNKNIRTARLRNCANGCELLMIFLLSTVASALYNVAGWTGVLPLDGLVGDWKLWLFNALLCTLTEGLTFWNGIIHIYLTSEQLGIRWRVIGILCGMIPIANLIVLCILIKKAREEIVFENDKLILNEQRRDQEICHTKYPILMVHGVFFRDSKLLNYWGRIPGELEKNGAQIYYGNHSSAASVAGSAKELDARIREIVQETGCEKVNVIAHSKGGLDCRYALSEFGTDEFVASLTTINTPHHGCKFADYLLTEIPKKQQQMVAQSYNYALEKIGDSNPDFIAAVGDLREKACLLLNEKLHDSKKVYCQSVGSKLNRPSNGRFPLNLSYHLVKSFDGNNDGLVGEESCAWGQDFQFITVKGRRGISHADMIDLNRENFPGFDVREFYVNLVSELREKGF